MYVPFAPFLYPFSKWTSFFSPSGASADPDLREYQREMALTGIAKRRAQAAFKGRPKKPKSLKRTPLFIPEEGIPVDDDEHHTSEIWTRISPWSPPCKLLWMTKKRLICRELWRKVRKTRPTCKRSLEPSSTRRRKDESISSTTSEDDFYATPARLNTQLKLANTTLALEPTKKPKIPVLFSNPTLLTSSPQAAHALLENMDDSDDDMEEVEVTSTSLKTPLVTSLPSASPEPDELEYEEVAVMSFPQTTQNSTFVAQNKPIERSITPEVRSNASVPPETQPVTLETTPKNAQIAPEERARSVQTGMAHRDPISSDVGRDASVVPELDQVAMGPRPAVSRPMSLDDPPSDLEIEWSSIPITNNRCLVRGEGAGARGAFRRGR